MSKELATIELNVPIEFNEDDLKRKDPDIKFLKELFELVLEEVIPNNRESLVAHLVLYKTHF